MTANGRAELVEFSGKRCPRTAGHGRGLDANCLGVAANG